MEVANVFMHPSQVNSVDGNYQGAQGFDYSKFQEKGINYKKGKLKDFKRLKTHPDGLARL